MSSNVKHETSKLLKSNVMNGLSQLLADRRTMAGYTQASLADTLTKRGMETSRETISHIEQGINKGIDPELANAIAELLPVSADELCAAMGYKLKGSPAEGLIEIQSVHDWLPEDLRPHFVRLCNSTAQGILQLREQGLL